MQWTFDDIKGLYELPFFELVERAHNVHKENFNDTPVELCTLLNIKTGACPEDCAYCPQSIHHNTGLKQEPLWPLESVVEKAKKAKAIGAKRFCMGAAWRRPKDKELDKVAAMIKAIKAIGLETCVTLGTLNASQARRLKAVGLDYYNHNLDTSPEYYKEIITTRPYEERLETLKNVAKANINVCCGGIVGMGETREDRINFILALNKLECAPKSIPINQLIPIKNTPLAKASRINPFEFIKTIAIVRTVFPQAMIRLSGFRKSMSEEKQAWCFYVGANSIFFGDRLLTEPNRKHDEDIHLLKDLDLYCDA